MEELYVHFHASLPTFILLQAPQGCGKTTFAKNIPSHLHVLSLSLDDFYLTHQEMRLACNTKLVRTRGPPGTHDVRLLKQVYFLQIYASYQVKRS
jgi:pantothenate kinase-related protein Tda10